MGIMVYMSTEALLKGQLIRVLRSIMNALLTVNGKVAW